MTLKTLSLSLQENTEDFSTLSYLTLTMKQLQRYCEIISNLQKLGKDYNWVVVSTDINTNIKNKDELEINKYFLSLIDSNA